jgi:hypothetical protein
MGATSSSTADAASEATEDEISSKKKKRKRDKGDAAAGEQASSSALSKAAMIQAVLDQAAPTAGSPSTSTTAPKRKANTALTIQDLVSDTADPNNASLSPPPASSGAKKQKKVKSPTPNKPKFKTQEIPGAEVFQPPIAKQNGLKVSHITSELESPFPKLQVHPPLASDAKGGDGKQKAKKAGSDKAKAAAAKKVEQKKIEQKDKAAVPAPTETATTNNSVIAPLSYQGITMTTTTT